jgi:hypothetical protein
VYLRFSGKFIVKNLGVKVVEKNWNGKMIKVSNTICGIKAWLIKLFA